jgi:hypothetical protein
MSTEDKDKKGKEEKNFEIEDLEPDADPIGGRSIGGTIGKIPTRLDGCCAQGCDPCDDYGIGGIGGTGIKSPFKF